MATYDVTGMSCAACSAHVEKSVSKLDGVKNVIVKLGVKGCYFRGVEGSYSLPPCEIRAVDATGAGDNFVAGFTCELLRGSGTEEALRFGNACGAICTTAVGAATALKSREQVLDFLKSH